MNCNVHESWDHIQTIPKSNRRNSNGLGKSDSGSLFGSASSSSTSVYGLQVSRSKFATRFFCLIKQIVDCVVNFLTLPVSLLVFVCSNEVNSYVSSTVQIMYVSSCSAYSFSFNVLVVKSYAQIRSGNK